MAQPATMTSALPGGRGLRLSSSASEPGGGLSRRRCRRAPGDGGGRHSGDGRRRQEERSGNRRDPGHAAGGDDRAGAGHAGQHDRPGAGGQGGEGAAGGETLGQQEAPPAQAEPDGDGGHIDGDEQRAEMEDDVAGGRQRPGQCPAAEEEGAGEGADDPELGGAGNVVPADGDEEGGAGRKPYLDPHAPALPWSNS